MTRTSRQQNLLICLCLAAAILGVYWPVCHFAFVSFDDSLYITENPHLRNGLTLRGLTWAFTTPLDQWMPVTWLTRMLEYQTFGLNAKAHHLVNVLFHIANAVLLFGVLKRMTGARWRSALVAALFALHPLHVEAVAWVTGLKDVLSTFFWLLTIWAYVRYVEQLNVQRSTSNVQHSALSALRSPLSAFYALTLLFFALGLMSKPMVVTLPFVLLLLDYWPLGRTPWAKPAPIRSGPATGQSVETSPSRLLIEKLPLFGLAAAASVVTVWAQHGAEMVLSLEHLPPGTRIANVLLSYVGYVAKTFWPMDLAVFYPLDTNLSLAAALVAGVGLVGITVTVIWRAPRAPWLVTGWLWYLGTLAPVIGLVQVGSQSMADRYTYVPLVGLFVMLGWSVPDRAIEGRTLKVITCVAAGAVLALCAVLSRIQVGYWKDTETLFRHALNVTRDNWLAHNDLGAAMAQAGRVQEAIRHYQEALRIKPHYPDARYNLGIVLEQTGRVREAIACYEQVLQVNPDYAEAHNNLGMVLCEVGQIQEAIPHYEQALRLKPDYAEAHNNLGIALAKVGRVPEAIAHCVQALRLKPDFAQAHYSLGLALEQAGRVPEAVQHYEQALRIKPDYAEAHNNLGVVLWQAGRVQEAIAQYEQALRIKPDHAEAYNNLGNALFQAGRVPEAIGHWEQALRIKPDYAEVHNNWGLAMEQNGKLDDAIAHYEQAVRLRPDYAKAHFNLGVALEKAGRAPEAIAHYEQALRLRPDFAAAQNNLARLRAAQ